MTTAKRNAKSRLAHIHVQYRRLLNQPKLTAPEIEAMRRRVILLAQTICEHVWRKKVY